MYDIHSHIIYGVDDGAQNIEEAVKMVEYAVTHGTKGLVATPHTNVPGSFENLWGPELLEKVKTLRTVLKENYIDVQIFCGQEIFCTSYAIELLKSGKVITLNNSRYPLVEFDFYEDSDSVYTKLERIISEGYIPVVAHPERYAFVTEEGDAAIRLKKLGCVLQINKGSLTGKFGENAFYAARRLIEERLADVIASDSHSPYVRTPNMKNVHELVSEEYSQNYADILLDINPKRILQDRDIITF